MFKRLQLFVSASSIRPRELSKIDCQADILYKQLNGNWTIEKKVPFKVMLATLLGVIQFFSPISVAAGISHIILSDYDKTLSVSMKYSIKRFFISFTQF